MCIHTGVGHTDESAQQFDSEKLTNVIVLLTGFEPLLSLDLEPMLYQLSHPVTKMSLVHTLWWGRGTADAEFI